MENKQLPKEKDDKLERFFNSFHSFDIQDQTWSETRERHMAFSAKREGDWILPPGDQQISIDAMRRKSSKKLSKFNGGTPNIAGLSTEDLAKANIRLSKREIEKFTALSQFQPGQIHNIPLNKYAPLPPIRMSKVIPFGH